MEENSTKQISESGLVTFEGEKFLFPFTSEALKVIKKIEIEKMYKMTRSRNWLLREKEEICFLSYFLH